MSDELTRMPTVSHTREDTAEWSHDRKRVILALEFAVPTAAVVPAGAPVSFLSGEVVKGEEGPRLKVRVRIG